MSLSWSIRWEMKTRGVGGLGGWLVGGGAFITLGFFFFETGETLAFLGADKKKGWLESVVFSGVYLYIYIYVYIYIPGTYLSSIFSLGPSKTRVFPIKTRGPIWVPGVCIYIYIYILVTFIARNPCSQLLHFMVSHFFSFSWGLQSFETSSAKNLCGHTFDGPEILRSPVEVGSLSHYLRRVLAPSQVVFWDFWTINSMYMKNWNKKCEIRQKNPKRDSVETVPSHVKNGPRQL